MRKALANLSLVVGSLVVTLLAIEIALRVVGYDPIGEMLRARSVAGAEMVLRLSEDPDIGYELVPGASGRAWQTDVAVNSHGMRDREYSLEKPSGTYRIAVLGDSKTFGNFLPIADVYTEVLERRLLGAGYRVEVLNFGVGGYDTVQEVAQLERHGVAFDPDLVVVGYCMNDVGVVSANLEHLENLRRWDSPIYRSRVALFLARQRERIVLAREARRANELDRFVTRFAGRIDPIGEDSIASAGVGRLSTLLASSPGVHETIGWYAEPERIGRLRYTFRRLSELAAEHGFDLAILVFPYLEPSTPVHRAAYDILRHEAERQSIDVLEVVDDFEEAGIERLRQSRNDLIHPGAAGHSLIAGVLEAYVRTRVDR